MRFIYPRLPHSAAEARLADIRAAYTASGLDALRNLVGFSHPKAAPVPTGGQIADECQLRLTRNAVVSETEPWLQGSAGRQDAAAFDRAIGRSLHRTLEIVRSDACHIETWNFLSLIVFPDIAVHRFPGMHSDRLLGSERNALRRTWFRHDVIGDLLDSASNPLGEDELVGIFERGTLAANHNLIRVLTRRVLAYDGPNRSEYARRLYKDVRLATGPRLLSGLSESELRVVVDEIAPAGSTVGAQASDAEPMDEACGRLADTPAASSVPEEDPQSSLEIELKRRLLDVTRKAESSVGYRIKSMPHGIAVRGAVEMARSIVDASAPSSVFTDLYFNRRLDLTVEALVADPEFSSLFEAGTITRAQERLMAAGYRQF